MTGDVLEDRVVGGEIEPWRRSPGKNRTAAYPGIEKIASDRVAGRVEDKTGERLSLRNRKVEFDKSQNQSAGRYGESQVGLVGG